MAMGRRAAITGIGAALGAASMPETGMAAEAVARVVLEPARKEDARFMALAIAEGVKARFAFGTVIVRDDEILARGYNMGFERHDPTAHGEMVAIRNFLGQHGPEALRGTTLYTTGEPCPMCMGAILWCGIARLVYAASIEQLATKMHQIMVSSTDIASQATFAPISITGGVLADEAMTHF